MEFYPTIITFHIIFAGIWLINILLDIVLRNNIKREGEGEKKIISFYLIIENLFGTIGTLGILVSGIILVLMNPAYSFFQMSANHWLATKQIVMVALLIIISTSVIPSAKKLRTILSARLEEGTPLDDEDYNILKKLYKLSTIMNVLIFLNFLLAITHRFFG